MNIRRPATAPAKGMAALTESAALYQAHDALEEGGTQTVVKRENLRTGSAPQ
jgi:hypothetical protein